MSDVINGTVTRVIDGDTFEINGVLTGLLRSGIYNSTERIRIADIDEPELNTIAGQISKENLERTLLGRRVSCTVQARDSYGRIVAEVRILE